MSADVQALPLPVRRCAAGATRPPSPSRRPPTCADVPGIIGQERAEEAVRFAIGIRRYGYNLYALGTSGHGQARLRARVPRAAARPRSRRRPTGATSTTSPTRGGRARCASRRGAAPLLARGPAAAGRGAARRHPRRVRERGLPHAEEAARGPASPTQSETAFGGARGAGPRARGRDREDAGRGRDGAPARRRGDRARGVPAAARRASRSGSRRRWWRSSRSCRTCWARCRGEARRQREELRKLDRLVTAVRHRPPRRRGAGALGGRAGGARAPRRGGEGRRGQRRGLPAAARGGERGEGAPRRARRREAAGPPLRGQRARHAGLARAAPRSSTRTTRPTPTSWAASSTWPSSATSSPTSR